MNDDGTTTVVVRHDELEQEATRAISELGELGDFHVTSHEDFQKAGGWLIRVKEEMQRVEDFFEPMRAATYAAYQSVLTPRKRAVDRLKLAEQHLKREMTEYEIQQEKERQRLLKEQRERELAEAKAAREAEIAEAQERGDGVVAATKREQKPVPEHKPPPPAPPKPQGYSSRKAWEVEIVDVTLLCDAVARGKVSQNLVEPNLSALKKLVNAADGLVDIPGIRVRETRVASARTKP